MTPRFKEIRRTYQHKPLSEPKKDKAIIAQSMIEVLANRHINVVQPSEIKVIRGEINNSFSPVQFYMKNTGIPSIKYIDLTFYFGDDVVEIRDTNRKMNGFSGVFPQKYSSYVSEKNKLVRWCNQDKVLVGGDDIATIPVYIKTINSCDKIIVTWRLLSDEFNKEGTLEIPVNIKMIEDYNIIYFDRDVPLKDDYYELKDDIEFIH